MTTISLDSGSVGVEFAVARANAIQAYATLEQSLCLALSYLAGTDREVAGIIFFKVNSARSRLEIIDKLYRRKHRRSYALFWNSVIKEAGSLDQRRNSIIHWNVSSHIHLGESGQQTTKLELIPANIWAFNEGSEKIGVPQLQEFAGKCDVYSRALNIFIFMLSGDAPHSAERDATWLPIFQQPLTYPLPENHPLGATPSKPETPPQPSPE
ncbi:MAG: hypothetical protein ABW199_00760 [Caulobacterales bacterium]